MASSTVQWEAPPDKVARLTELRQAVRRAQALQGDIFPTPGALAKQLDSTTLQTPALDIIDRELVEVDRALDVMLRRRRGEQVEDAGNTRLIISMPPQEGKSERTSHYGVLWMLRRHPELRIGIVSYEERIAQRMSYLLRNDLLTYTGEDGMFDIGLRLRTDNRSVGSWNLDGEKGSVYAVGIGGALTGRPIDLLVIDDPVKDYRAADSSLQSDLAWQWWMSVARTRLAPGAPVIVILTRWHEADLAGRLLAKQTEDERSELQHYDRWNVVNISAQADYRPELGETDPLGREPDEFMVSARGRTQAQWESTKGGVAPRIWSALYQGRPTPDSGDVFNRTWWRRYDVPIWSQQPDGSYVVPGASEVIQSWDMAFKDKSNSDFVAGQVWARRGADVYLVDQVHARLSFTDTIAAFRRLVAKWPQASAKLVEDKANGTAVIDSLRKEVGGIIPINPRESKIARARAISPFIESGNVHLPEASIALFDVAGFIEECTSFDNGAHDDQVDAMSQALQRFNLTSSSSAKTWLESLAPPCPNCSHPNPPEAHACSKCGFTLSGVVTDSGEPTAWSPSSPVAGSDTQTMAALDALRMIPRQRF